MTDHGPGEVTPAVSAAGVTPPPMEGHAGPGPEESLGRLGRYVVLELLGAGGMGVVYAAYDPRLDRKVAVKLLHPGDGSSGHRHEIEARLLREAQALARLADPHVVTVYDVGSLGSRIFVAMEYVPGSTLLDWLRAEPRTWQEVRRVFRDAGLGLAAAHEAGLVHRDVKANNVMVRDDGEVRVLDFGLARLDRSATSVVPMKALANSGVPEEARPRAAARTRGALGTPSYMAPEQMAGGEVGPAADLFSFCVALYLALYGVLPHEPDRDPKCPEDWRVRAPPKGSKVPAWLHQVVVRGLSFDPADRQGSMRRLLRDLGRDPWRVRRRWLAAAGAVGFLLAGLAAQREVAARRDQLCRGGEAKLAGVWDADERQRLVSSFLVADPARAGFAARAVSAAFDRYRGQWLDLYTSACEATHRLGEQSEDLLDRRMLCLDKRRRQLGALSDLLIRSPGTDLLRAVEASASLAPLDDCSDVAALMAPEAAPPDPERRQRLEAVQERLASAQALLAAGRFAAGLTVARETEKEAVAIGFWPTIAEARLDLGRLLEASGDTGEAANAFAAALRAAEAGGHDRVAAEVFVRMARVEGYLRADADGGREYADLASAVLARLETSPELEAELADHRGLIAQRAGDLPTALAEHRRALELRPEGESHPVERARSHLRLGTALKELGSFDEASEELWKALRIYERTLGPEHPEVATILDRLGALSLDTGSYEEARKAFEWALEIYAGTFGEEHSRYADTLVHLGTVSSSLGDLEQALAHYRRAEEIYRSHEGEGHPNLAVILNNIGSALTEQGFAGEALDFFRRAHHIHLQSLGPGHLMVGFSLYNLSEAHNELGAFTTALRGHRQALEIWSGQLPADHYLIAHGRLGEGRSLLGLGRFAEAEETLRRSLELWPATGRDPAFAAEAEFELGRTLFAQGREEEGLGRARAARETLSAAPGHSPRLWRAVEAWLEENGEL